MNYQKLIKFKGCSIIYIIVKALVYMKARWYSSTIITYYISMTVMYCTKLMIAKSRITSSQLGVKWVAMMKEKMKMNPDF